MLDRHALQALTTAIARGDGAAFRNLYNDRAGAVYGLACRITGTTSQAVEVLQNTFVEAWRLFGADGAKWEAPDLELLRICRRHAADALRRHGRKGVADARISDPVNDGTASFELLNLLQILGKMTSDSREMITTVWFDCPSSDELAERFSLTTDETTQAVRLCYAEFREVDAPDPPVLDRSADLLAMRQALGLASEMPASDTSAITAWERAFASFGELIAPIDPPEEAFAVIMDRVNAAQSVESLEKSGRKTEIWRAVMFVLIAAVAAILIYLALVAIGDDAAAQIPMN